MLESVNWNVFADEERKAIEKLVEMGERDSIALGVLDMTPEKEKEIQKIADSMRPVSEEFESEEAKKYKIERLEKGQDPYPQSPEEEAILQKRLDDEMRIEQERQKKMTDERTGKIAEVTKPAEVVASVEVKAQFCSQCSSKGVRHLAICPTNLTK